MKVTSKLQAVLNILVSVDMDDLAFELADVIDKTDMGHGSEDEDLFGKLNDICEDLGKMIVDSNDEPGARGKCAIAILAINAAHRELATAEDPSWEPGDVVPEKEFQSALDLIEKGQQVPACIGHPEAGGSLCAWCHWPTDKHEPPPHHKRHCPSALLLRSHGRKVSIEGDS